MSNDALYFVAGTVIAILLAIPGFFAAKYVLTNRQSQKVDGGGTGYQAGGNIKIDHKP